MTPGLFLLVSLAGGVGAATRLAMDGLIRGRTTVAFPLATTLINVLGSFLLGVVTGLALAGVASSELRLVAGTGFLGGYTTFSTASFETVRLAQERRYLPALVNGVGMLGAAVAAAALGWWLASAAAG